MMSTRELLELALLDAFGVLDEGECADFESALAASSTSVRAQVRSEQDRIMRTELAELAQGEPDESLRDRVLEAVRQARLEQTRQHRGARPLSLHAVEQDAQAFPMRRHRKFSALVVWRAAALAFAAATVVFGWSTFQMRAQYETLAQAQSDDALFESLAAEFGREFVVDALVDPDTQRHFLRQVVDTDHGVKAEAAVWMNPDWKAARFFAISLPPTAPGTQYRLAVLDEDGNAVQDVLRFEFAGQLVNREVKLDLTIENPVLGIVGSSDNGEDEVLLVTSPPTPGA